MQKLISLYKGVILFAAILLSSKAVAQGNFYKFSVTQEGVYRITAEQAAQLGAASVEELSFYGYPGMIPQKLDSNSLQLQEIPVSKIGNDLFIYLVAAERMKLGPEGTEFLPHHYTDTLHYLVQTQRPSTLQIPSVIPSPAEGTAENVLYRPVIYKNEEHNLLSSGRNWYGERVFGGESIILNYSDHLEAGMSAYFQGRLLSQSLVESSFDITIGQAQVASLSIPSIPNSTYGIKGREKEVHGKVLISATGPPQVKMYYQSGDRNATGYLDYFMLGYPYRSMELSAGVYYNLNRQTFLLDAKDYRVWDVSDFYAIEEISVSGSLPLDVDKIAVFKPETSPLLQGFESVAMDLRIHPRFSELVIITHPALASQAERLAAFKNSNGTSSQVVTLSQIYGAFGYGNVDISAIRNFLAFHFHHGKQLKHVLLFGKGTFDYKHQLGGRPNWVPTYSSRSSLNPLTTYSSDDYFGFLELGEGDWQESEEGDHSLDIGIGRLPVISTQEAKNVVDKIIAYASNSASGNWKRKILFVADDGDNNVHLNDSEKLARQISARQPEMLVEKLYLDSYSQENHGVTQKAPAAKAAFETLIDSSALVINYIGHGNETTLMAEELFTISDIANWRENARWPLFVTATCEFGRHDSPLVRSGAEEVLVAANRGAIALLTTGRPVFSNVNFALNQAFMQEVFERENGQSLTLGELYRRTKNNSLNGSLNRNFSLLGDPSLRLALPELQVVLSEIAQTNEELGKDALVALKPIRYRGRIADPLTGADVQSFQGQIEILVAAPPIVKSTKGDESQPTDYEDDKNIIFRGTAKVEKGVFEGELLLPPLPDPKTPLRLKFYAMHKSNQTEAIGYSKVVLKQEKDVEAEDKEGPIIDLALIPPFDASNLHSTWVQIKATLSDANGISLLPAQGISIQVNEEEIMELNDYFSAAEGSFVQGSLIFPVSTLKEGKNKLVFKAYDNQSNSSSMVMELWVSGSNRTSILSHQVFPNPADRYAQVTLTHNRSGENLLLGFEVYSMSGSKIISLSRRFPNAAPTLKNVTWYFMQINPNFPAKGMYLYKLELQSETDGSFDRKNGKLLIQ
ncbi:MAG TPA: type IX secretion system sortase PorU [Cyclobacteriaceae bacterium]|nr:type IX secretion system sortase PorU [Cyclobacteriaceae bacterium]